MDRDQFRHQLELIGLDCAGFASLTGYSLSSVYRFGETNPVPRPVRCLLRLLESHHAHAIPVPLDLPHEPPASPTPERFLRAVASTFER